MQEYRKCILYVFTGDIFLKSGHEWINGCFQLTKYYRHYFLLVLSCQNVIKFNISQIIYNEIWYRTFIVCLAVTYVYLLLQEYTLSLTIIFKSIVSAFLFILSYFLSSEILKSFTKLNHSVSLSFCNPF